MIRMIPGIDFVGITTPFYCIDDDGYIAVHRRTDACRDERQRWDAGSGQLEFGRNMEENALKEIEEEYGVRGEIIGRVPAHDLFREQDGVRTHWIAVPFFVRVPREQVRLTEPHKHTDLRWVTLSTMPEPLHSGFAYALEQHRDVFERFVKP